VSDRAIVVDLDGTLADIRIRLWHLAGKKMDRTSFDKTIKTEELRDQTVAWHARHRVP
jgi:beta-phosphoglucomutase-like phosphatase (HAD superfamily)